MATKIQDKIAENEERKKNPPDFEDLKKANEQIQTTPIKGNDYAAVAQRVKAFRMVYPDGFILTHEVCDENGVVKYKCEVGYYAEDGAKIVLATGSARESQNASYINKTSYIENCETSAVGRALGFAGFGIETSICSADELAGALEKQEQAEVTIEELKVVLDEKVKVLMQLYQMSEARTKNSLCNMAGIKAPSKAEDYKALIAKADEIIKEKTEENK